MKRFTLAFITCALLTSCLAQEPSTSNPGAAAGRTPGPYDSLPSSASAPAQTLTPAGATIMDTCAKVVFAEAARQGETTVKMHHLTAIDRCAALARAALLAR